MQGRRPGNRPAPSGAVTRRTAMPVFVVLSGLPASGKSTLGRALAAALGLPFLDKDDFLEALFVARSRADETDRQVLSRLADEQFRAAALATPAAVLASWWRHPLSTTESGTPIEWLTQPSVKAVEVHCRCPAAIAVARFTARRRHPGHGDAKRRSGELLAAWELQAAHGPLLPSQAIVVDGTQPIGVEVLGEVVRQALADLPSR